MKAILLTAYGDGSECLVAREVPDPSIGPGDVLVDVHAAGFNRFDCKLRRGWLRRFYPLELPHVLGNDFAGIVRQKGARVFGLEEGDRVYGMQANMRWGAYAETVAVDASLVRRMPANLDFVEAASIPLVYQTAWMALAGFAQVRPGHLVLVHGAAGAVGSAAVQLAKALGARVAATCRADAIPFVREIGADFVVDYTTQDFTAMLGHVDAAFDPIGGQVNLDTYRVMRRGGTLAVVLREDPLEMQNRERLSLEHGVRTCVVAFENMPEVLDYVRPLFEAGTLRPVVRTVLPLTEAAEAHRRSDAGHARGKTVLAVRDRA